MFLPGRFIIEITPSRCQYQPKTREPKRVLFLNIRFRLVSHNDGGSAASHTGKPLSTKSPASKKLSVNCAESAADRERIYQFRYRVVVEALGTRHPDADHERKRLESPLDDGSILLYLAAGDEILASLRLTLRPPDAPLPAEYYMAYQIPRFAELPAEALAVTSSLVVAPGEAAPRALASLLGAAYKLNRAKHVQFDLTHCAAAQIELFQRLGYRQLGRSFAADGGLQVPLVLVLEDLLYLKNVGSPLLKLAHGTSADGASGAWFRRRFPEVEDVSASTEMQEGRLWDRLAGHLNQPPLLGVPLLRDLSFAAAKRLVASGNLIRCSAGETVVKAGQRGQEMYVVLTGAVEIRATPPNERVLATLDRGELFGEIGFLSDAPRSASAVALTDVEMLVLTQDFFRTVMAKMPDVASQVLFNLSVILCERLVRTTEAMVEAKEPPALKAVSG
jgi:hypothetical protein